MNERTEHTERAERTRGHGDTGATPVGPDRELLAAQLATACTIEGLGPLPNGHAIQHHWCAGVDAPVIAMRGVVIGPKTLEGWSPPGPLDEFYEGYEATTDDAVSIDGTELWFRNIVDSDHAAMADVFSVDNIVAAAEAGAPVKPNLVYFPRSNYTFHPGAIPKSVKSPKPQRTVRPGTHQRVLTLDTGMCTRPKSVMTFENRGSGAKGDSGDPFRGMQEEVVRGHGPAIADFVGAQLGTENSLLATIDHSQNAAGVPMLVSLPSDPGKFVRCFDELALLAALRRAIGVIQDEQVSVLNLSLGALSCPAIMGRADPIYALLQKIPDVAVVVAAGNHGTDAPSYPAVYGMTLPGQKYAPLANVVSVGASTGTGSKALVQNSAKPSVVDVYAPGQDILLDHPDHGVAHWTGTSFAAPYVAVELASGPTTVPALKGLKFPF